MSNVIRMFGIDEEEYKKLKVAAAIMTFYSKNKKDYYVDETFFDFGQGLIWTTVLCSDGENVYQALNPREQENVLLSETVEEIIEFTKLYFDNSSLDEMLEREEK